MNSFSRLLKQFHLSKNEFYLIIGILSFVFSFLTLAFLSPNYFEGKSPKKFVVHKGESLTKIVENLYEENVITNSLNIKIVAFFYGAETKIKAGRYSIKNGLNYFQIIDLLVKGSPNSQVLITIPEGMWQNNLADLLEEKLGISSKLFLTVSKNKAFLNSQNIMADNLEGYLLPNTYYFHENSSILDVVKKLKTEMDKIFEDEEVISQMAKLKMTKHQILTLASIIDGESNKESEFKLIAGVYYNRLKKGIRLQADPTIQYLKRNSNNRNKVLFKDLEIKSPYNTYLNAGLPPSPINNPGKSAVLAAIFPEKTNFIYFVADGTGGHKFSKSLSEHNENVRAYRKWRNSQWKKHWNIFSSCFLELF